MDATFEWTARSRSACLSRPDERTNQLDESTGWASGASRATPQFGSFAS